MPSNRRQLPSTRHSAFAFRIPHFLLISALLTGSVFALTLKAPEPPPTESANKQAVGPGTDPAPLIAKLSDSDWRVRDQATRSLIAIGAPARTALRTALGSADAEVRWRAFRALSQIEIGLDLVAADPARSLYLSAAQARLQKGGLASARIFYEEVVERFPDTRWAAAARERLAGSQPEAKRPAPPKLSDEAMGKLVARLGAAAWAERQEASCRLAELGAAARAALEAGGKSADPEVAWRARRLLDRLPQEGAPAIAPTQVPRGRLRVEAPGQPGGEEPGSAAEADLERQVRLLSSEESATASGAREVLLSFGRRALLPLIRGLDSCSEVGGVEIVDLLQRITGQKLGFDPDRWRAWWRTARNQGKE